MLVIIVSATVDIHSNLRYDAKYLKKDVILLNIIYNIRARNLEEKINGKEIRKRID